MTELVNPATGVRLEEIADSEVADVAKAVARAREAFEQSREAAPGERARVLLKVADLIDGLRPPGRAVTSGYLSTVGAVGQPCFAFQALTVATGDLAPPAFHESRKGHG
jgi:hypothetical protein